MNLLKLFTFVGLGLSFTLSNLLSNTATAASIPTITYEMVGEDNSSAGILKAPDFSSITFRSLGSFSESGAISSDYDRYAGYGLDRQWYKGDTVTDVLKLGDIDDSFGVGQFRLGEIVAKSGRQSRDVTLDQIGFIKNQTISSFIEANPQLKNRLIQDVPPIADAIFLIYGDRGKALLKLPVKVLIDRDRQNWTSELSLNKNIKKMAQTESPKLDVSEFEMGNLDLSELEASYIEQSQDEDEIAEIKLWDVTIADGIDGGSPLRFPQQGQVSINDED